MPMTGHRRRIENRVGIPNGTAAVSEEAVYKTKVSHWVSPEKAYTVYDTQVRRPAQMR